MRQQQNNKNRMRNRGRNKPGNNPNRNFESNGPDVKIRGNASHIAEKYTTLARDALSSGDTVVAENYLQHAEHYNRIILAAQAQREEAQANRMRNSSDIDDQPDIGSENCDEASEAAAEAAPVRRRRNASGEDKPARRRPRKAQEKDVEANDDAREIEALEGGASNGSLDEIAEDKPAKRPARTRRPTRRKTAPSDGMSEDAASLPQGLFAGSLSGEGAAVEEQ